MNEVVKFLRENSVQYFATVGKDNKAKAIIADFSSNPPTEYSF